MERDAVIDIEFIYLLEEFEEKSLLICIYIRQKQLKYARGFNLHLQYFIKLEFSGAHNSGEKTKAERIVANRNKTEKVKTEQSRKLVWNKTEFYEH
jgi:hypothetical protein